MRCQCALVVGICALAGGAQGADTLLFEYSPYHSGIGGEFKLTPLGGANAGATGLTADLSLDSLESFCMQSDELIAPGSIYRFEINTGVPSSGGFDPLDDRTAYLYTYFRNGVLPGFDYGAGRTASSGALQDAIWFIEGESLGVNNAFVAQANAAVGPGGVWEGKGIGGVRVLNLFSLDRIDAQDQLTIVPGSGAIALAGAAGLLGSRRRRR